MDTQDIGSSRTARVVLVVEDDTACRDELCDALRSAGYAPLEAINGVQALNMLVSGRTPEPALILLDLAMPQMTGEELLTVLSSYTRLARIPVILMSAHRSRPYHPTDTGWLPKPFSPEVLLEEVTKRCRKFESRPPTE